MTWTLPRYALVLLLLPGLAASAAAQDPEGDAARAAAHWAQKVHRGECPKVFFLGDDGEDSAIALGNAGFLGVDLTDLTPELRRHFGAPEDAGVLIARVEEGSPAAAAGLQVGDVLTRFDGEAVGSALDLTFQVRGHQKGDVVEVELLRDGSWESASTTLDEAERCGFDVSPMLAPGALGYVPLPKLPQIDHERLEKSLERLHGTLPRLDVRRYMEQLEGFDSEEVEERLEAVMERLERLEKELDETREKVREGGPEV